MAKGSVVVAAVLTGALMVSGCAEVVAGKGDAQISGWVGEANQGLELAFAEPTGIGFGTVNSDLIREPASLADLAIRPDFEPMIDALPLGQEVTEADGGGGEVATSYFDDSLMDDDGVLPPRGVEAPSED